MNFAHLKDCNPCQVVVDNIRNTIRLYKNGIEVELPPACREKLHSLLKARISRRSSHRVLTLVFSVAARGKPPVFTARKRFSLRCLERPQDRSIT